MNVIGSGFARKWMKAFCLVLACSFLLFSSQYLLAQPGGTSNQKRSDENIEVLIEALYSSSKSTREIARSTLVRIGKPAVPALIQVLSYKPNPYYFFAYDTAIRALAQIGQPAVGELIGTLSVKESKNHNRRGAMLALGRIGENAKGAIPALIAIVEGGHVVRSHAALALEEMGAATDAVVSALLKAMRAGPGETFMAGMESGTRWVAARAIGKISSTREDVIVSLVHILENKRLPHREMVCIALQNAGSAALNAIPALTRASQEENDVVRRVSIRTLKHLKEWALHTAAKTGDLAWAKDLLKRGTDVNALNDIGNTPISLAAANGDIDMVKLFLDKGGQVEGDKNMSPLFYAAAGNRDLSYGSHRDLSNGHTAVVKLLLDNGADVNKQLLNESRALHSSAMGGHIAVVRLLLDNGADVNAKDSQGSTPLHFAAAGRRDFSYGRDPLSDHTAVVRLLLDNGADVNAKDSQGSTPLHFAARGGHRDVVALLIDNRADVHVIAHDSSTPLSIAHSEEYRDIADLLKQRGKK